MHWDGVFFENFQSAYNATMGLIHAGNRRLGVLTGGNNLKISRDRYRGFTQAVSDCKLKLKKKDILEGDFFTETAFQLSRQMFLSKDYPEGILSCNNRSSIGLLKAAAACGITIGKDIALIGIDQVPILNEIGFPFSCISRNNQEMGHMAMRLLMERIRNPTGGRKTAMVPYHLELNGSERKIM